MGYNGRLITMKKFFGMMAMALVTLCFVACGTNSPDSYGKIKFEVTELTQTSFHVKITPPDKEGYAWGLINPYKYRDLYEKMADDPKAFVKAAVYEGYIQYYIEHNLPMEEVATYGTDEDDYTGLYQGYTYFLVAFRYDEKFQLIGDVSYCKVTTLAPEIKKTVNLNMKQPLYYWYPIEEYECGILFLKGEDEEKKIGVNIEFSTPMEGPDGHYVTFDRWAESTFVVCNTETKETSYIRMIDLKGTEDKQAKAYTFSGELVTEDGIRYTFSVIKADFSEDAARLYQYE